MTSIPPEDYDGNDDNDNVTMQPWHGWPFGKRKRPLKAWPASSKESRCRIAPHGYHVFMCSTDGITNVGIRDRI